MRAAAPPSEFAGVRDEWLGWGFRSRTEPYVFIVFVLMPPVLGMGVFAAGIVVNSLVLVLAGVAVFFTLSPFVWFGYLLVWPAIVKAIRAVTGRSADRRHVMGWHIAATPDGIVADWPTHTEFLRWDEMHAVTAPLPDRFAKLFDVEPMTVTALAGPGAVARRRRRIRTVEDFADGFGAEPADVCCYPTLFADAVDGADLEKAVRARRPDLASQLDWPATKEATCGSTRTETGVFDSPGARQQVELPGGIATVQMDREQGLVTVSSLGAPTVWVRRLGPAQRSRSPLGARSVAQTELIVDGHEASIQRIRGGLLSFKDHEAAGMVDGRLLTLSTSRMVFGRAANARRGASKSKLGVRIRRRRNGSLTVNVGADQEATPTEIATALAFAAAFGTHACSIMDLPKLIAYSAVYILSNA